jgi:hypothetical protein
MTSLNRGYDLPSLHRRIVIMIQVFYRGAPGPEPLPLVPTIYQTLGPRKDTRATNPLTRLSQSRFSHIVDSIDPQVLHLSSAMSSNPPNEEGDFPPDDEQQQQQNSSNVDREIMGVTSRGTAPRVSRRKRSEYARSWNRSSSRRRVGETGSKYRSRSRH